MKMKHHIVQSIALFLAGIAAVTSQQVDPSTGVNNTLCSSIPAVDFFDAETGHVIFDTYPISSIETCLASLQVDKDHMIAHISALNKVFSQYYAFYNIARAPEASAPKDHQAELGYTLFNSPDEGVVDIDAEFTSIIQKVEEEGATLASFWEIQSVANRLRDGHVNLPSVNAEDLAGTVFFLPERCADGAVKGKHSFSNDPLTEELQLKIDWEDENGTKSESVVESMNGMTPYQFFLEVSNSPSIAGLVYQSRGARLNSLLTNMRSWSGNFIDALGEYNQVILPVRIDARPSDAYTPEVLVKYADGGEEMYHAYLKSNFMQQQITGYTDSTVDFNVTALEEHINKQGSSHAEMMQAIEGTFSVVDVDRTIPQPQPTGKEVRSVRSGEDEESESFFDTYNEAEAWALKFMDRYAVLKMESFDDIADEKLLIVWMALSRECKRQGITKLIVDISNNGGGKGILGPTLATLMYPTAAHNWYTKNNALVINEPMQIYRDKIEPLLDDLIDFFQNKGNTTDGALGAIIEGLTDSRMKQVNDAIDIFRTFCVGITAGNNCASLDNFQEDWATFSAYKSPPLLKPIIDQMVDLIKTFNRFSEWDSDFADFDKTVVNTVNQGGETNLTSFFTDYTSDMYYRAAAISLQNNANFDEYILLSNGVAGSTAHTFSSKVMQLWNNRDKTQVTTKLTAVSYGGLKEDNGDVTMACLTALVGDVHLENELIAAGVVYLLNNFFLDGYDVFDAVSSALEEYYESLPDVPYFVNSLPRMPLVGDYDTALMGEDTVPLQYIKMLADEHISTYYLGTTIGDDSDLEDLYEEAAKFLSAGSETFGDPTSTATAAIVGPFGIVLTVAGAVTAAAISLFMG